MRNETDVTRTCPKCGVAKPPAAFYTSGRKDGLSTNCKVCVKASDHARYRRIVGPAPAAERRKHKKVTKYGADIAEILEAQPRYVLSSLDDLDTYA
jgi:hypothetical protein